MSCSCSQLDGDRNKRIAEFPEVWQRVELPGRELLQTSVFSVPECWTINGEEGSKEVRVRNWSFVFRLPVLVSCCILRDVHLGDRESNGINLYPANVEKMVSS